MKNERRLSRILVVDDDDWIVSGVTFALESSGFEVFGARDGREGLDAALRLRPDLIITDVLMPRMDGWSLVRTLRAQPDFALVPVLFLTSKLSVQDRICGFQLGADDYLGKPANLAELPRRVLRALAQRRQLEAELTLPEAGTAGGKGLGGSLDQVGMATLLSVLAAGRRSGILRITGGLPSTEVLVYLVRGQIHRVEVQGRGRLSADQVLNELFSWLEGGFEFSPMALRLANEINFPVNKLLMEGARRAGEPVAARPARAPF